MNQIYVETKHNLKPGKPDEESTLGNKTEKET